MALAIRMGDQQVDIAAGGLAAPVRSTRRHLWFFFASRMFKREEKKDLASKKIEKSRDINGEKNPWNKINC
jgi:hypothetical protein